MGAGSERRVIAEVCGSGIGDVLIESGSIGVYCWVYRGLLGWGLSVGLLGIGGSIGSVGSVRSSATTRCSCHPASQTKIGLPPAVRMLY